MAYLPASGSLYYISQAVTAENMSVSLVGAIDYNGGSAKDIGSASTALNAVAFGRPKQLTFGSTVVSGTQNVTGGLAAGTFGTNGAVIRWVTSDVAGVANTTMSTLGLQPAQQRMINKRESVRGDGKATAIRAGYWNIYGASWNTTPTTGNDMSGWLTTQSAGSGAGTSLDDAASPTAAKPGELVYSEQRQPKQDDYKPRSLW